jgi:hypothetical protein
MSSTTDLLPRGTRTARELPLAPPAMARPGISWAAALAGAAVAAAVSIMLISFGSGLGLAAVSPLSANRPSVMTFTVIGAIWLIIVQWVSAFFGGYLAGRLRPSMTDVHTDEVGFRDTATGFVAWAVATVFVVAVAASGATGAVSGVARAAGSLVASVAGGAAQGGAAGAVAAPGGEPSGYLLDVLFRAAQPDAPGTAQAGNGPSGNGPSGNATETKAEAGRILATGVTGDISQPDRDYLAQLVAARTGLAPADAGKRVDAVIAREKQAVETAKQDANAARKAAAAFSLYAAVAMLIGAFIACVAAALGGRQRDAF